jgi:broad specificity phosphatase PhoE
MAYLKFGNHPIRTVSGTHYIKSKPAHLEPYAFNDVADIYPQVGANDKLILLIRHAQRPDDQWDKETPLTPEGVEQARSVGVKLRLGVAKMNEIEAHSTDLVRTQQTAFYIFESRFDTKYPTVESIPTDINIDADIYRQPDSGGVSYDEISQYAYHQASAETMAKYKDIAAVTEQVTNTLLNNSNNKLTIFTSHDSAIIPYIVEKTHQHLTDLKFWQDRHWLNFCAGMAIIVRANGHAEFYPVRGLDSGTFRPDWA